nr:unnamed protein product [Callosobruchus chinensis]
MKQLLDGPVRRSMEVKGTFDRDTMNLLKKNEQHEALDQLKKAEKECDQSEEKSATRKQKITQLEAENLTNNKNNKIDQQLANLKNLLQNELVKGMAQTQAGSCGT